jgi:histidinol-phosphatase
LPFEKELEVARLIARRAGELALSYQAKGVSPEYKPDASPVTIADKETEKLITSMLAEAFPEDGLLGEEGANKKPENGRVWIVDPIDGTRDFIRGNPLWSVLIGLEVDGVVEAGVTHLAPVDETYFAIRGQGAYRNDSRIRISGISSPSESVLSFNGFNNAHRFPFASRVVDFCSKFWAVRSMGGCVDAMMLAGGRAEVWIEPVAQPWDLAPLRVIMEEAGARFLNFDGGSSIYGGNCAAFVPALESEVRDFLNLP